jgi:hypothetical protein
MRIRLTRKFAELIDGIDLSRRRVGDVIDLPVHQARTLIAEGWATAADESRAGRAVHRNRPPVDTVADRSERSASTRRHCRR